MEESVKPNIREELKEFFADLFRTDSETSEKDESELPPELLQVVKNVDKGAENLIDRKYTPKRSKDLLRKNSLRKNSLREDLKGATKSSPEIQSAEFVKKSKEELEENTK